MVRHHERPALARSDGGAQPAVGLALETPEEARLWTGILSTQGVAGIAIDPSPGGAEALCLHPRLEGCRALIADVPVLLSHGATPAALVAELSRLAPHVGLFVRLPGRTGISVPERRWARAVGIASLLPGSTVAAWESSVVPVLERILGCIEHPAPDTDALGAYLASLVRSGAEPRSGPVKDAHGEAFRLDSRRLDALEILEAMQSDGGVARSDRSYRGTTYRDCFVASEAVDWVERAFGLDRALAATACTFLWRTGRIHHVLREAPFADDYLFFRFGARRSDLDRLDLVALCAAMRGAAGPAIADRTYLGKRYARCFVGSEAVEWIRRNYGLACGAAESVGQSLLELGITHHVLDRHGFVDANFFYRFRADEAAS